MKIYCLVLFLFTITLGFAQVPENPEDICPLLIGEKLPDTKLLDSYGKEVSLSELLNKQPTVMVF